MLSGYRLRIPSGSSQRRVGRRAAHVFLLSVVCSFLLRQLAGAGADPESCGRKEQAIAEGALEVLVAASKQATRPAGILTLPKTNIDPENGTVKGIYPLQTSGFQSS